MQSAVTKVLVVGSGGIGTIAALNIQLGGQAEVTCVLRSNFQKVSQNGFKIESIDHGVVESFRPSKGALFLSFALHWVDY